jgi:predicted  nucleic acid-binding Zn-ribbon protein
MMKCTRCGTFTVRWIMSPNGQYMLSKCSACGGENCEVAQPHDEQDNDEEERNETFSIRSSVVAGPLPS